jgi:hypothetical protein
LVTQLPHYDYDPRGIINEHYKVVSYIKNFIHQQPPFDYVFVNIDDFDQEINRGKSMDNEEKDIEFKYIERILMKPSSNRKAFTLPSLLKISNLLNI